KSIVQSSAVATFVVNAEHKVLYWNGACEDLTGIKSEDLLGTSDHWKAFYDHPRPCVIDVIIDDKVNEMTNFYKVYAKSDLISDGIRAEGWYPNLGGKNRYIVFDAAPIRDDNGKLIAAIETLQDITKRKQAEDALQESEERYRTILENIEDGYFEVDIAGNFTFFNDSVCRMVGYTRSEMMGMNNRQYTDKENSQISYQAFNKVFRTGEPSRGIDYEIIGKDGTKLYIQSSVSLIRNTSGQPIGFRGIMRNITERKQAEEACRNAEERYRTLFEQSPNGILLIDTETGKTIESNETARKQLGYTREEFAALRVSDYEVLETPEETAKHIQKIIQGGIDDFETQHRTKSGEIRNVHVWAKTIQLSNRNFIYTLLQDITEHRHAEKQLQDTLESLRKAVGTTIQVMVSVVESRDPYTAGHQIRSADLARAIATEMELPQNTIEGLRMAGSIHDIGKLSIPAEILSKPTKLTNLEFSLIKEHARRGYEMLKDIESPWPLAQIVYQHHERMDGSGYPRNLKGEEILIEARILSVADVVEAMASHRPYRPGLGIDAALSEIEKNKGIFYDEAVVDACLRLFREKGFKLEGT
ncbi:MAG: PAS domain S-box protein, partial [Smithellaceae bacterium]|nr:PAS domain S-box protein [Smithellaceae bacterium]